jgi:OOP family OmpA-OmpF porin
MSDRPIPRRCAQCCAIVLAAFVSCAALAANTAQQTGARTPGDVRASLFGQADKALAAAKAADAAVLAPHDYADGAERFARAEETLDKGGNLESIQDDLAEATALLVRATRNAAAAARFFATPLRARQRAQFAGASRYAEAEWQDAEEALVDAAGKLERGRTESAGKNESEIVASYETAELAAIKANYLQQTRNLLARAEDLRGKRVAPQSWAKANELLAEAEAALEEDRYDTDRPRNLAQEAEQNAYQAVYVAELEERIRDGETSLEAIVMSWESEMRKIADLLEVPVRFDAGPEGGVITINRAIDSLHAELADLRQGVDERDAQIAELQRELGGKTESLDRVNALLARQERLRARVASMQQLFTPREASVLRQDDAVIIRLIGINFASGSATLGREHQALLGKVRTALAEFPESTVVIEGHTDSFGSDTANQQLSQSRANAVLQYLVSAGAVSPVTSTSLGYGESRPVASNETTDGRRRNRRIDVVVHPQG